jgi:integrase
LAALAIVPKRQWPSVRFQEKRAITWEEHCRIVERERNPERKAFYKLAWYLGASQSDLADLQAEDVDWPNRVISFFRMKTRWRSLQPPQIRFGKEVEAILATLPKFGDLFPSLANVRPGDRATEFKQRCDGLGIRGISLHSYRYAWAERAKIAGHPERFAQLALGHNSKAVRKARMRLAGGGKSGGARVIYLYLADHDVIFLATLYKKSKRETLADDEKQNLKEAARRIKAHFKLG